MAKLPSYLDPQQKQKIVDAAIDAAKKHEDRKAGLAAALNTTSQLVAKVKNATP